MDCRFLDEITKKRPERLALLFGLLIGGITAVIGVIGAVLLAVPFVQLQSTPIELDFHAYYFAGKALRAGDPFIGWAVMENNFLTDKAYVYPPITAVVFLIYSFFPEWYLAFVLHIGILLGTFYLAGVLSVRYIASHGRELEPVDTRLIIGFFILSGPSVIGYIRGNIDPIILLLIITGFIALEGGQEIKGGVLWAVAALFKLFPAVLGVWMLYRRTYRAIAAAVLTGGGLLALGVVLLGPEVHVEFVEFILTERSRSGAFSGGLDPTNRWLTLRRPLSQFLPLSERQLFVVSAALLAPVVIFTYVNIETDIDRLVAFFATYIAVIIGLVPATAGYVVYFLFPLVPLVYLVEYRRTKWLFIGGLILIQLSIYPQDIDAALTVAPVPSSIVSAVNTVVYGLLSYGSVLLWGCLLMLLGCVVYVFESNEEKTETPP